MFRLWLALPLLAATVASAQQIPMGRILVRDGISAALMPLNPPPALVEPLTAPERFLVSGVMISVSTADSSVESFHVSTRVETASGARFDFAAIARWNPSRDWATQIFYTGKDPVVKVLTLTVIPLQANQVKNFEPEPTTD
jgi:hypothetical protein